MACHASHPQSASVQPGLAAAGKQGLEHEPAHVPGVVRRGPSEGVSQEAISSHSTSLVNEKLHRGTQKASCLVIKRQLPEKFYSFVDSKFSGNFTELILVITFIPYLN